MTRQRAAVAGWLVFGAWVLTILGALAPLVLERHELLRHGRPLLGALVLAVAVLVAVWALLRRRARRWRPAPPPAVWGSDEA